jgi:hypothetical protein
MTTKLPLYLALLTLTQCSSCKNGDPSPLAQLPPATQVGANTFGCLVNGQAWSSKTSDEYGDYRVTYEPGVTLPIGGNLNIIMKNASGKQAVVLGAGRIFQARTFALDTAAIEGVAKYINNEQAYPCNWIFYYDATYLTGNLTLTRLDERAGVIAGTFEFTIFRPGCDTIRVTQGRFDHKI